MNAPECSDRTPADADAAAEPAADAACAEKASADEAGVEKPSAEKPGGDTPPQVGAPLEPAADGAATNAPPPAPPAGKPAAGPAEEIARRLKLDRAAVAAAIDLLDAGASPLFIARYRPDEVGGLSKADAQAVRDRLREARRLDERRASILRSLAGQTKLTDARRAEFERADSLHRLEDLHLPLKPRKPSPGAEAVRQGLLPLAEDVLAQSPAAADLDARLADFVDQDRGVPDAATALAGAGQILAERFSEDATLRGAARAIVRQTGRLRCRRREGVADKKAEPHKNCFDLDQPLRSAPAHRVMAINRGERAGVLQVSVESDAEAAIERGAQLLVEASHTHAGFLRGCVEDAITRLVLPSLYEEARRELNEAAEAHALEVFARNLRSLLLAAPAPGKRVLGVDPGYKTGCHYAAMDALGRVLQAEGGAPATGTLQIIGDDRAVAASRKRLAALITGHAIDLIALGNGKACRSTEAFIAAVLAEELPESGARYAIVNEAGASAYSTSTIGREELPDLEPPARCAVSIGRRLQDPLAELAKIDPASVGVGLYQHDLRDKPAAEALEDVVAACVGCVGVDANTAGAALLRHVPGLNPLTARRVVQHRAEHGAFATLDALREAMKLSDAAYQQAAGVLRIAGGDNPLDATRVHPESYATAEALLAELGATPQTLGDADALAKLQQAAAACDRPALAAELGVGPRKLDQLLDALTKPGADPRAASPGPITRRAVVKLEDLQPGAELRGTVQNVVDFGAFIDIGLRDSGLVHISRMSTGYVSSPHDLVAVGDAVRVWVASVDADKRRVALSLVEPGSETKKPARGPRRRGGPPRSGGKGGAGSGQPAATGDSTDATGAPKTASGRSGSAGKRTGDGQRGSQQGNQRGSQQGGRPRHKQGGRGKPGRKDSARHSGRRPTTYETRSKAPPKPITPEMEQGAEAMRTFGDLLQFHRKKSQPSGKPEEPPTGKPEEQPTAPPAEQPAKASDGTQGEKPDENRPDENLPPQA